jgi:hypothetical protein
MEIFSHMRHLNKLKYNYRRYIVLNWWGRWTSNLKEKTTRSGISYKRNTKK